MGNLTFSYEGYWQCRQATDPDPSDDPRGASGYTFAVGWENDLDQIIRLQQDEIDPRDFRVVSGDRSSERFGVFVTQVTYENAPWGPGQALQGGKVRWLPAGEPDTGPRFEMRNTIIYHPVTNGIFMPIVPFGIQITDPTEAVLLSRDDPLDPDHPEREIWQIADVEVYRRRCPQRFVGQSDEAIEAIGLGAPAHAMVAFNEYFQKRKEWLQLAISGVQSQHTLGQISDEEHRVQRQALEMRLFALTFKDSFEDRLGLQAEWEFDLLGAQIKVRGEETLGGRVAQDRPWHVRFWMGGFDGDLHRGYMRGTLTVPFEPNPAEG
jgi:hypothetical protein